MLQDWLRICGGAAHPHLTSKLYVLLTQHPRPHRLDSIPTMACGSALASPEERFRLNYQGQTMHSSHAVRYWSPERQSIDTHKIMKTVGVASQSLHTTTPTSTYFQDHLVFKFIGDTSSAHILLGRY
ncbi:hypothetical protein VNO77_02707 [Canavalia gladiata]|uniref:Uncharacterized protein n=1 Tax=Canavalia gladiata TaxID=3824 RepID=A0AAN9MZY9_CANGL